MRASTATLVSSSHSLPTMDHSDDSQENLARSIIPDPLGELPAWFKRETEMAAANTSSFRIKYALHSPKGPQWYRNHHLLPPSTLNRPPSLFSPSFPPMAASVHSLQDRSEDSTRLPGPSRSPSGTPLPTPSSSQVRIPDRDPSLKPRSRKTSQDNVDLMDVSDPWGTHWHHQSPYDAGSSSISPVSVDSPEGIPRTRSRLSSTNTGQARRKTVTPSPLSQSTSALHLQTSEPAQVTRKLSKRRMPVLAGLFGTHEKDKSEPPATSPVEISSPKRLSVIPNGALHINFGASKRHSIVSPMSIPANGSTAALSSHSSSKNDKRQSVLGRLVRKFSVLRRSGPDSETTNNEWPESTPGGTALSVVDEQSRRSFVSQRQLSPEKPVVEKKASGPSKRVPPPRIDMDVEPSNPNGPSIEVDRENSDRTSSVSYDVPFSPLGKLMIANPDAPSSGGTTPVLDNALPPEAPSESLRESNRHAQDVPGTRPHTVWPQALKPSLAPPSAGRSSPIPGLLSPISVAVPTITFPEIPQFTATATTRSPVPSIAIPPSSPSSVRRQSTSAPVRTSISPHTVEDLSSRSSPSPAKEGSRPFLPHLVVPVVDDSPLSKASVLANPPTPYNTDEPHTELPVFESIPTDRSNYTKQSQDVVFPKQASPTQEADGQRADGEVRLAKSSSATSRKTETYKLVRTQSDKVSTSSEAVFQAEGEQWFVVNSAETPRRRRTKDKVERVEKSSSRTPRERARERGWGWGRERDKEGERDRDRDRIRDRERARDRDRVRDRERERERDRDRVREREWERDRDRDREGGRDGERERDKRRGGEKGREEERERRRKQDKATRQGDQDQRRTTSHAMTKSPPIEKADSGSLSGRPGRARSLDSPQRPLVQPLIFTLQDEPPHHRKNDDRSRDSVYQSKSPRPGPSSIVTVARVDHLPSVSARPTSELTSAADMNALKAREVWEMDRLWKGRSMFQGQPETGVIASPSNNETARDAFSIQGFAHGSSHTSYVVQPLQAHPIPASVFYANMPAAPPPIIYAAASPYGQPHPPPSRDYTAYRSPPNTFTFPSKMPSVDPPSRPNPLPAPPRESSYQPARLPVLADRSSGSASEYWGNYTHSP